MDNIVIKMENVSKKFGNQQILKPTSIEFEAGKIYGLVGRNGSGKTVFLKLICGFLKPSTGKIIVNGVTLGKRQEFPSDVGVLIEKPGFLSYWSGYKNLEYLSKIQKKITKEDVHEVIKLVGLKDAENKKVGKYSKGMRQRLGIAQALMENPHILLLDEPMNGLDNQGAREIRELLQSLKNTGRTILLASHIQEDIACLCDVVYLIDQGTLIKQ